MILSLFVYLVRHCDVLLHLYLLVFAICLPLFFLQLPVFASCPPIFYFHLRYSSRINSRSSFFKSQSSASWLYDISLKRNSLFSCNGPPALFSACTIYKRFFSSINSGAFAFHVNKISFLPRVPFLPIVLNFPFTRSAVFSVDNLTLHFFSSIFFVFYFEML